MMESAVAAAVSAALESSCSRSFGEIMYGSPATSSVTAAAKGPELRIPADGVGGGGGLLRYRSAPSTLLGDACDDFLPARPASPETMLARFLSADLHYAGDKPPPPSSERGVFGAAINSHQVFYGGSQRPSMAELVRQSSSPAGMFSRMNVENGYGLLKGVGGDCGGGGSSLRSGCGTMSAAGRMNSNISFSSLARQGSIMSQISEVGSESAAESSPEDNGGGGSSGSGSRCFIPGTYQVSRHWEDSPLLDDGFTGGLKRPRDAEVIAGLNQSEAENGLAHQFSLPKTSSEMAAMEKLLQFHDTVPCKVRAKRGCATHPRSIAERMRRTRISERMRKLQELVPNMDKQTNTADMLDLAVEYINCLQKQVKVLSDNRASCTCGSSNQKPNYDDDPGM